MKVSETKSAKTASLRALSALGLHSADTGPHAGDSNVPNSADMR